MTFLITAILAAGLLVTACGKKPSAQKEAAPAEEQKEAAAPAPAAGVGTIKGKVSFTGTPPVMPDLNRQADPFCAKTKMKAEFILVNSNGTLKNVAVMVKGAKGEAKAEAKVVVNQVNCMYTPRVQAGVFEEEVEVVNEDPTLHNVHTYNGTKTIFNRAQPKGSPPIKKKFSVSNGDIIKFKCDVHPWMTGWLINSDNGFSAVTGDSGEFEITGVPTGSYTLKSFQEHYGEKTQEITVEADKVTEVEFSYDGSEKAAFNFREVHLSSAGHIHSH